MHPIPYDIRKILTSKTVLVAMALLIAISFLLVSSFAVTTNFQSSPNPQILSWYDTSGNYHFLVFETNQFGQGVSGVSVQANLSIAQFGIIGVTTQTNSGGHPVYKGPVVSTNSSGEAEFTIQVPTSAINEVNANYTAWVQINSPNGGTGGYGGFPQYSQSVSSTNTTSPTSVPIAPGQIVSITQGSGIYTVTNSKNSQLSNILVIWAGAYGAVPKGYSLYYQFVNETCTTLSQNGGISTQCTGPSFYTGEYNETNMKFLAHLNSYSQVFSPPALEANSSQNALLVLNLFYPNGTAVFSGAYSIGIQQLYPQAQAYTQEGINQLVLEFFVSVFGLFIPLIAIVGSYNTYGKDRVSGVLESVLAQPVSRRGLSISRFSSTFVAMVIAISISMGVVDGIVWYYTKSFVSSTIMLASSGAFFAELAAFIGIMMLLSRVLRSSGLLIGVGIALFIVIDFFWGIIISLLASAMQINLGSLSYYGYLITGEFLNPAQFVGLVDTYLTHQATTVGLGGFGGFGFPISPSQYGITIPTIVLTGLLWGIVPLAGFLYLAIKKD